MKTVSEHFAVSLVSLALTRGGFTVVATESQRGQELHRFDLLATKRSEGESIELAVEVKSVPKISDVRNLTAPDVASFPWPIYRAVYAADDEQLIVDDELAAKMHFHDEDIVLHTFSELAEAEKQPTRNHDRPR